MKVAVLLDKFLPLSETFILTQLKSLSDYNDVYVLYLEEIKINAIDFPKQKTYPIKKLNEGFSYKIHRYLINRNIYHPSINIIDPTAFKTALKAIDPDVCLIHFGNTALLYQKTLVQFPKPKFIYFHGYDASKMLNISSTYKKQIKSLTKHNYHFLFVSEALKKTFNTVLATSTGMVIHLGIDVKKFPHHRSSFNANPVFVQVARFTEKKGHNYLIEAFAKYIEIYEDKNCELWLAGDGPLMSATKSLVIEKKLQSRVLFLGVKNQDEIVSILQHAGVYVQHSITSNEGDMEGLPIAIMEAMAIGLPIVSTLHSGIKELVEHGINGYLSEEKDILTFCNYMHLATQMDINKAGRLKIEEDFNTNTQSKKLVAFMNTFIS